MNINATLIGQSITFLIFLWFCKTYIWSHILNAMKEREEKIAEGLLVADRAAHDLELVQQRVVSQLKEAKEEASAILNQAQQRGVQIVDAAKEKAIVEGDRIKLAAQSEVDQSVVQAKEQLRSEVAILAFQGAERILGAEVDRSKHQSMLDQLSGQLLSND